MVPPNRKPPSPSPALGSVGPKVTSDGLILHPHTGRFDGVWTIELMPDAVLGAINRLQAEGRQAKHARDGSTFMQYEAMLAQLSRLFHDGFVTVESTTLVLPPKKRAKRKGADQ